MNDEPQINDKIDIYKTIADRAAEEVSQIRTRADQLASAYGISVIELMGITKEDARTYVGASKGDSQTRDKKDTRIKELLTKFRVEKEDDLINYGKNKTYKVSKNGRIPKEIEGKIISGEIML